MHALARHEKDTALTLVWRNVIGAGFALPRDAGLETGGPFPAVLPAQMTFPSGTPTPSPNRAIGLHTEPPSVNPRDNPVLHPGLVLFPLLGAVFLGAVPVVVTLTVGEQRDDEDEVGPGPEIREIAEYEGN